MDEPKAIYNRGKKRLLPSSKKAQQEFVRELLSKNQERFEELFDALAAHDPKRWIELYIDLTKHTLPKQSDVNVNIGVHKDFAELQMLGSTFDKGLMDDGRAQPLADEIADADFEEIKTLGETQDA